MASVKLGQLYGGGGFTTSSFSLAQTISPGASGDILSITAPAGKKVRLDSFSPDAGQAGEVGITINVDGVDIVTNQTCGATSSFVIGKHLDSARWAGVDDVVGNQITVTKVLGSTASILRYSYSFGE